ncbi:Ig-like domain-containing protein [Pendulispora rubella]|uniref:Ig-like domain-containing protein n=1 Tax=Pendulispora rubella TaxID=2741070 RepID=A0ABZ2L3U8_9BACT
MHLSAERSIWTLSAAMLVAGAWAAYAGACASYEDGGDEVPPRARASAIDGGAFLDPGEQVGENYTTFTFGNPGSTSDGLQGTGMLVVGSLGDPPGSSLRFFDGAERQHAGVYEIAYKNDGAHHEQVSAVLPTSVPASGVALADGTPFDGTALWLGHSRFQPNKAPRVGQDSPPIEGAHWDGSIGPADPGSAVRSEDAYQATVPIVQNRDTRRSFVISAQVYAPTHEGANYGIRPQASLQRIAGPATHYGLTTPGGLGMRQVDLSSVVDRWALLQVRVDVTTNGGSLADSSDDTGHATFRYFLNGNAVGNPDTLSFDQPSMQAPGLTGPVSVSPGFGLTRGWQGDAPEVFLDNISLDAIVPKSTNFVLLSPASSDAGIRDLTKFRVSTGNLQGVASVEYLLNGKPIFANQAPVLPLTNGPQYEFDWHTANWFDGFANLQAVARDGAGNELGRTAVVPFKIANGPDTVRLISPDPTQTLHGQVDWTVGVDDLPALPPGRAYMWLFYVDGKDWGTDCYADGLPTPCQVDSGIEYPTYSSTSPVSIPLDTTRLSDGVHELYATVRAYGGGEERVLGATQVTIHTFNSTPLPDGGRRAMDLRAKFKHAFVTPGETAELSPRLVYPDGTNAAPSPPATLTSSDASVASVAAGGTVQGVSPGFATITAKLGDFTATTLVEVRASHDAPQFTRGAGIVTHYTPGPSLFPRILMHTAPGAFEHDRGLGPAMQQASLNSLETEFYFNACDYPDAGPTGLTVPLAGAGAPFSCTDSPYLDATTWRTKNDDLTTKTAQAAMDNHLNIYLTADSITRQPSEAYNSIYASDSKQRIPYVLEWAKRHNVIGIDMSDEITMTWYGTGTPTDDRWLTRPSHTTDRRGIQLNGVSLRQDGEILHDSDPRSMWLAGTTGVMGAARNAQLIIVLPDQAYDVDGIRIWNYYEAGMIDSGVKDFTIETSADNALAPPAGGITWRGANAGAGFSAVLAKAPEPGDPVIPANVGEFFPRADAGTGPTFSNVRSLRFTINSTYRTNDDRGGIAEIMFSGKASGSSAASGLIGSYELPPNYHPVVASSPSPMVDQGVRNDGFLQLMNTMNSTPGGRPPVTWTALGRSSPGEVKGWTGDPRLSDYNGTYWTFWAKRRAYPYGGSMFEVADGMDVATLGRRGAYLPGGANMMIISGTGPDYRQNGPGDRFVAGRDTLLVGRNPRSADDRANRLCRPTRRGGNAGVSLRSPVRTQTGGEGVHRYFRGRTPGGGMEIDVQCLQPNRQIGALHPTAAKERHRSGGIRSHGRAERQQWGLAHRTERVGGAADHPRRSHAVQASHRHHTHTLAGFHRATYPKHAQRHHRRRSHAGSDGSGILAVPMNSRG